VTHPDLTRALERPNGSGSKGTNRLLQPLAGRQHWNIAVKAFTAGSLLVLAACQARPSGDDWPDYDGPAADHFSPLADIDTRNVGRLGLAWHHDIDVAPSSLSAPVAVDGILYFVAGHAVVHALDARNGRVLWRYDPEVWKVAGHRMRGAWGTRGLAWASGRIFVGTADGRLIALDARSGKLVWSVQTLEPDDGRYITGAPWVFNGKVVIGHGGADFAPVRGYVTAYDQRTGKQLWRFYTVPGNPAKGFENEAMQRAAATWSGEWWKLGGGGTVWNAMAYDPKYNRIYIGTGNGAPWNQKIRSPGGGDNLFLCSIIALDADSGAYLWHYQVNPGETWDYNAAMDIELADLKVGAETVPVILHAPKNGFFYILDRENGKLISAQPFARVNWAKRIDTLSGRPVENPQARFPAGKVAVVAPSGSGAHSIEAMSFNPLNQLAFIPGQETESVFLDPPNLKRWHFDGGQPLNSGMGIPPSSTIQKPPRSFLVAWDPQRQKPRWRIELPGARSFGGTATTAGGLVFAGDSTGFFKAYAASSGEALWSFGAQTAVLAQPITYRAGGRQLVTVIAGSRAYNAQGQPRRWDYRQQQWRVLTFALDGKDRLPPPTNSDSSPTIREIAVRDPAASKRGSLSYVRRCMICHGANLVADGAAPSLPRSSIPPDAAAFSAVVRQGALRPNGMPGFEQLSDSEVEDLRQYVLSNPGDAKMKR
jgi:quinohemoprotein ethanol dehydrogenase